MFCVFSGDGVNRLRVYLNETPETIYDTEGTMYDDRDPDAEADGQVAGMMHAAALHDDDDEMEEVDDREESHFGGEIEG